MQAFKDEMEIIEEALITRRRSQSAGCLSVLQLNLFIPFLLLASQSETPGGSQLLFSSNQFYVDMVHMLYTVVNHICRYSSAQGTAEVFSSVCVNELHGLSVYAFQ